MRSGSCIIPASYHDVGTACAASQVNIVSSDEQSHQQKQQDDLRIAPSIEEIELEEKIGSGAFSTVYKGRQKLLDRTVAVKVLSQQHLSEEAAIARFQQEAKLTSALSHPNIIKVMSFGVSAKGEPYLVMEYASGITLTEFMKDGEHRSLKFFSDIFLPLLSALNYAHGQGVVHRDIKPSNIILTGTEEGTCTPKLVDFGIAKVFSDLGSDQLRTKTGILLGTPTYMSPEQCAGQKIDGRSDIYSLACVMYEYLTGQAPFRADSQLELMRMHTQDSPGSVSNFSQRAAIGKELAQTILTALSKDPASRPASAAEFSASISKHLQSSKLDQKLAQRKTKAPPFLLSGGLTLMGLVLAGFMLTRWVQQNDSSRAEQSTKFTKPQKSMSGQLSELANKKGGPIQEQMEVYLDYRRVISKLEEGKPPDKRLLAKAYAQAGETINRLIGAKMDSSPKMRQVGKDYASRGADLAFASNEPGLYLRNCKNFFQIIGNSAEENDAVSRRLLEANAKWSSSAEVFELTVEGILHLLAAGDVPLAERMLSQVRTTQRDDQDQLQALWTAAIDAALKTRKGQTTEGAKLLGPVLAEFENLSFLSARARLRMIETVIEPSLTKMHKLDLYTRFLTKEFKNHAYLYEEESSHSAGRLCELIAKAYLLQGRTTEALRYGDLALKYYERKNEFDEYSVNLCRRLLQEAESNSKTEYKAKIMEYKAKLAALQKS